MENEDAFSTGQHIEAMELTSADSQTRTLTGIVSHITKTAQHVICGIRFEFSGPEDLSFIVGFNHEVSV